MTHAPKMRLLAAALLGSVSAPVLAQAAVPAATATPATAFSQAGPEDIVVTAQRREQSLLKVPLAISAVSGQASRPRASSIPRNSRRRFPTFR